MYCAVLLGRFVLKPIAIYNFVVYWQRIQVMNKKPCGFIDGPFIPHDTQFKKAEYIESA